MSHKTIEHTTIDLGSFVYSTAISKNFGVLGSVLEWCKNELQGEWRWRLMETGNYMFYFDNERDCLAFTLKWL